MDHVVRPGDKKMLRVMILGVVASGLLLAGNARLLAQDALKLAVGAKGIWDQSISELAQNAGIFRSTASCSTSSIPRARVRLCRR